MKIIFRSTAAKARPNALLGSSLDLLSIHNCLRNFSLAALTFPYQVGCQPLFSVLSTSQEPRSASLS